MENKRNLVIVRAGDHSLHREWLQPVGSKNFDLWIQYYGDQPGRYREDGDVYAEQKGTKWPGIHSWMTSMGDRILDYDAIWLPDDDVSTNAELIRRMFELFHEEQLMLAQPALTKNAFFRLTVRHIDFKLRYTSFVEGMAPIFSREALRACWPTFNKSLSGRGLEHVWVKLLGNPDRKIAIIDETPIRHTRRQGEGELYRAADALDPTGTEDSRAKALFDEFGIVPPAPEEITFYDGILKWNPQASATLPAAPAAPAASPAGGGRRRGRGKARLRRGARLRRRRAAKVGGGRRRSAGTRVRRSAGAGRASGAPRKGRRAGRSTRRA